MTTFVNMAGKRVGEFKTAKSKAIFVDGDKKSNVVIKKVKKLRNGARKNSSREITEDTNSKVVCLGFKNDIKKKIKVIETKNLQASKTSDIKRKKPAFEIAGRVGAGRSVVSEINDNKESCNGDVSMHDREKEAKNIVISDNDSTDCSRRDGAERSLAAEFVYGKDSDNIDVTTNYLGRDAKDSVIDDGSYKEKGVKDHLKNAGEFSKCEVRRMKIEGSEFDDENTSDSFKSMCRRESIDCKGAAASCKKERALLPETDVTSIKIVKSRGKIQNCKVAAKAKISQSEGREVASRKKPTKRKNSTKVEENSMKYSKNGETSSANTTQMQRRILANARERTRVHKLSEAFDLLRSSIPSYTADQKLSKLSILRIAISYISALGCLVDCEKSTKAKQMFAVSVDNCTLALQSEFGRAKGARRPKNATELDDESTKDS